MGPFVVASLDDCLGEFTVDCHVLRPSARAEK